MTTISTEVQFIISILFAFGLTFYLVIQISKNNKLKLVIQSKRNSIIRYFLISISVIAAINYFYSSRAEPSYIHRWDMFHTIMGVKYFEELGYKNLYECAVAFDSESHNYYEEVEKIRDLSTLRFVSVEEVIKDHNFNGIFTPERRKEFIDDLAVFNSITSKNYWKRLLRDKGYNGSPFYSFIISFFVKTFPLTTTTLLLFSFIDIILIILAFFILSKVIGINNTLIAFIFFCVNFPNRYEHMGGSLLRFDYIVYLIISISLLYRKKYGFAAVFMALSTMIRIFPAIFAIGLIVKGILIFIEKREIDSDIYKFFKVYSISIILLFLLSFDFGRGFENWLLFKNNMEVHTESSAGYRIGFKHIFMYSGDITRDDEFIPYSAKGKQFDNLRVYYYLSLSFILLMLLAVMYKQSNVNAMLLFGLLLFNLLFVSTRYYYSVLVLFFLFDGSKTWLRHGAFLFWITAITYAVYFYNDYPPFIYNYLYSFLLLVFVLYILMERAIVLQIFKSENYSFQRKTNHPDKPK